jgi:NADH-quinone oxidoreductase subunit E
VHALIAVATFYDMLFTHPVGRHHVYVCTNISCSLCGADELYEAFRAEVGDDETINLREFECLGACDIAPMVSIDGAYVGPIEIDEVPTVVQQIRDGEEVLPAKQLSRRKSVDPNVSRQRSPGPTSSSSRTSTSRASTRSRSTSAAAATSRCARPSA